jgi:hypothetical protein
VVTVLPHSTSAIDVDPFLIGDTIQLQILIKQTEHAQLKLLHTVTLSSRLLRESCEPHWLPVHPLLFSVPLLSPLVVLAARGLHSSSSSSKSSSSNSSDGSDGSSEFIPDMTLCLHVYSGVSMRNHTDRALTASMSVIPVHLTAAAAASAAVTESDVSTSTVTEQVLMEGSPIEVLFDVAPHVKTELLTSLPAQCNANRSSGIDSVTSSSSSSSISSTVAYSPDLQCRLQFSDNTDVVTDVANCFNLNFEEPFCTRALLPYALQPQCEADNMSSSTAAAAAAAAVVLPVVVYTTADDIQGGVELTTVHIQPRLVLHNSTLLPLCIGLQYTDSGSIVTDVDIAAATQQQQQLGVLAPSNSMQLVVAAPAQQQQSQHSDPFSVSKTPLLSSGNTAALAAAAAVNTCITISGTDDVSCHVDSSNGQLKMIEVDGGLQCSSGFVKVVVRDDNSSSSSSSNGGASSTRAVMLRVLHCTDEHGVHTVTLQLDPHPSLIVYNRSQQALVVAVSETALLQLPANSSFELPRPTSTTGTDSATTAAVVQRSSSSNSSSTAAVDAPPSVSGSRTAAQKSGKVLEHKYKLRLANSTDATSTLDASSDDASAVYCAEQWLAAGIQHIILHKPSTTVLGDAVAGTEHEQQQQQQQVMLQVHVFASSGSTVMSIRDTTLYSASTVHTDSNIVATNNNAKKQQQQSQQLQQLQAVFTGVTVVLLDDAVLTSAPRGTSLACALTPVARVGIGSLCIRHTVCPHSTASSSDHNELLLQTERLADSAGYSRSECAFSDTTITAYTSVDSAHPNSTHELFRFRPYNNRTSTSSSDVANGFLASIVRVLPVASGSSATRYEAVAVQCAAIEVHYDESVVLPLLAFLRRLHVATVDSDSSSSSSDSSATVAVAAPTTEVYIGYLSLGTVPVSLTFIGHIKQVSVNTQCTHNTAHMNT